MNKIMKLQLNKKLDLKCGRNPHQAAALYTDVEYDNFNLLTSCQLTYEDMLDMDVGAKFVSEFHEPVIALVHHAEVIYATYKSLQDYLYNILPECALVYSTEAGEGFLTMDEKKVFPRLVLAPSYSEYALRVVEKNNLKAVRTSIRQPAYLEYYLTRFGHVIGEEDDLPEDIAETFNKEERLAYAITKHNKSWSFVLIKEGAIYVDSFCFDLKELQRKYEHLIDDAIVATDKPLAPAESDIFMPAKTAIFPGENIEEAPRSFKLLRYTHTRL